MVYFLMVLVASVFLGTEAFAISTPFAQMTIYRVCALSVPLLLAYFVTHKKTHIKIRKNSYATFSVCVFVFWWLWSVISLLWVEDIRLWLQAVFLLTLGISSVVGLYLWVKNQQEWKKLIRMVWFMMTLLVLLGYYEIITNHYLFADMGKLDKYNTFVSEPMTRIPITHFENQNDFATMLLAYVAISLILTYLTPKAIKKGAYFLSSVLASYLILRSGSRMIVLCLIIYAISLIGLQFQWNIKRKYYIAISLLLMVLLILSVMYVPSVQETIDKMIYTGTGDIVTGDTGRVNLIRNGLIFLATTLGFGVGAGNIESWMENYRFLPTRNIVNMHNWWGEILVGYGIIVFALYVVSYGLIIFRLFQIRKMQSKRIKKVTNQIISFLIAYLFASMTSANNILIEWHWVFFGLIISYIKICENELLISDKIFELRKKNEFNYNFK